MKLIDINSIQKTNIFIIYFIIYIILIKKLYLKNNLKLQNNLYRFTTI